MPQKWVIAVEGRKPAQYIREDDDGHGFMLLSLQKDLFDGSVFNSEAEAIAFIVEILGSRMPHLNFELVTITTITPLSPDWSYQ